MNRAMRACLACLAALAFSPEPALACGCYYPSAVELAYWFIGSGLWLTICLLTVVGLAGRLARLKPAPLWPSRCLSLAVVLCAAQVPMAVLFLALLWTGVRLECYPENPYVALVMTALPLLTLLIWAVRYWRARVLTQPAMAAALASPLRAVPAVVLTVSGLVVMAGNWLRCSWLRESALEPVFVATLLGAPLLALVGVGWNHFLARRAARRGPGAEACSVGGPLLLNPSDAICRICGSEIGAEPVTCNRCLAPHHTDCWKYAGRCATYGCGGTRRMR